VVDILIVKMNYDKTELAFTDCFHFID